MNGADLWRLSLWRPDFIFNFSYKVLFCLYVYFKHPFSFTLVCAKFTVMYCSVTIASFSVYIHQTFGVVKKSYIKQVIRQKKTKQPFLCLCLLLFFSPITISMDISLGAKTVCRCRKYPKQVPLH